MEKKSKTIKMETKKPEEQQRLSYEQLEQAASYFKGQYDKCLAELQEADKLISSFNDVGMLLSIIRQGENFEPAFIERCSKKVQKVVTEMLDAAEEAEKEADK